MKKYLLLLPVAGLILTGCTLNGTVSPSPTPETMVQEDTSMASPDPMMADDTMAMQADGTTTAGGGVMVGGAMMVPSKDIVDNAMNSKDHTTVVAAVKAAGLVETLKGKGPFTVFAPTNAAFNKLPAGTVDTLLKPENKAMLTSVLTYHVVPGRYTSKDLKDGQTLKTVQGQNLTVTMEDGKWWVIDAKGGKAMITTADVISSNGVTFVVDTVLMPK
jgi:uncharacterized surface protein with fasciclin (FAS1) repeats